MKILSSDIQLSSESRYYRSNENTLQILDEEGRAFSTSQSKTVEEMERQDSARFISHGDTVDINRQSRGKGRVEHLYGAKMGENLNEDLLKKANAATAFEWAADTIDAVDGWYNQRLPGNPTSQLRPGSVLNGSLGLIDLKIADDLEDGSTPLDVTKKLGKGSVITEGMVLGKESLRSSRRFLLAGVSVGIRDLAGFMGGAPIAQSSDNRRRQTQYHEVENTQVQAGGVIQTADGRSIDFSLTIGMHRENKKEKIETFRAVDPLVINFAGTSAQLKSEKMAFDLDNDGKLEQISKLHEGSGFLALDINNDGEVNSGNELFGPSTGNGFQELSLYDKDKNGWIDENDPIWEDLKVWVQNDTEKGILKKLSETGIGAIHLGSVASEFLVEDSEGRAAGMVRASGVALTEDGQVKSVQQVDLIV